MDISEVETHQFHHLFTLVVSQGPEPVCGGDSSMWIRGRSFASSQNCLKRGTYPLDLLCFFFCLLVLGLLNIPFGLLCFSFCRLSEISQSYESGGLIEFRDEELHSLARAMFTESEKRAELLKKFLRQK